MTFRISSIAALVFVVTAFISSAPYEAKADSGNYMPYNSVYNGGVGLINAGEYEVIGSDQYPAQLDIEVTLVDGGGLFTLVDSSVIPTACYKTRLKNDGLTKCTIWLKYRPLFDNQIGEAKIHVKYKKNNSYPNYPPLEEGDFVGPVYGYAVEKPYRDLPDRAILSVKLEQPEGTPLSIGAEGYPVVEPNKPVTVRLITQSFGTSEDYYSRCQAWSLAQYPGLISGAEGPSWTWYDYPYPGGIKESVGTFTPRDFPGLIPLITRVNSDYFSGKYICDNDCLNSHNFILLRVAKQKPPTTNLTLNISKVRIGQVVWDPTETSTSKITLVAGKTFAPEITLASSGATATTAGSFRLKMLFGGNEYLSSLHEMKELGSGTLKLLPEEFHIKTTTIGNNPLTVSIVPTSGLILSPAPTAYTVATNVVQTKSLKIGMFPVNPVCSGTQCYSKPTEGRIASQVNSVVFLSDFLPVPDNSVIASRGASINGSTDRQATYDSGRLITKGMLEDLARIGVEKRSKGLARAIGVVAPNYFSKQLARNLDLVGMAKNNTVLLREDVQSALGHELVHTLVPNSEVACVEDYSCAPNKTVNGYDARNRSVKSGKFSIMQIDREFAQVWIDDERYSVMLRELQKTLVDPEILIISGTMSKSGRFTLLNSVIKPDGFLDPSDGYDIEVRAKAANGASVQVLSLKEDFKLNLNWATQNSADTLPSSIATTEVPVTFAIQYDNSVDTISIALSGNPENVIDPSGVALKTLIDSIPKEAFKKLPLVAQAVLSSEVTMFGKLVAKNDFVSAAVLLGAMKIEVQVLTKDFSQDQTGYSKTQILDILQKLIDSMKRRIKAGR